MAMRALWFRELHKEFTIIYHELCCGKTTQIYVITNRIYEYFVYCHRRDRLCLVIQLNGGCQLLCVELTEQ